MKSIFLVLLLTAILLLQSSAPAQVSNSAFHKGSWELNLTGSLGSINTQSEYSYLSYSSSHSENVKYFQLGVIPAYYITQGLSFEPEINIFTLEGMNPAYMLLGSLGYTFKLDNPMFYPFVHAGYGITNAFQVPLNSGLSLASDKMDIGVLNLGAGLKTMLGEGILLRTEINYRSFSNSTDESGFSSSYTLSSVALVFGFSFLL